MLTKPRFLFFLLKRKFYNSENNVSDNNNNDNMNNYANNHNNYDNKMKSRNGKPTEDPLCSKKKNTDGSLFTLVSFYRFLGSSIFPFIPFF